MGIFDELDPAEPRIQTGVSAAELKQITDMLAKYSELYENSGAAKWFVPGTPFNIERCTKHRAFFAAGSKYYERLFMAGNRCGKSVSGAIEAAYHATGDYPSWWEGRRFNVHTYGWAAGDTARTTRDTVQRELLGPPGAFGTGTIPRDRILKISTKQGVAGAIETVEVLHVTGGVSTINFLSYEQGPKAFYGTARHWIWLDEECPELIYNECLVRTMMLRDFGQPGSIFVTFTPLHGLTPFIVNFMKNADLLAGARGVEGVDDSEFVDTDIYNMKTRVFQAKMEGNIKVDSSRAVVQAGWADAPWLGDEVVARMQLNTPPHLLEARMHGYPSIGSGNVYPVSLSDIVCDPFEIPAHWKHMYALDVGWNRTAALWAAINPEDNQIFIYSEHYMGDARPELHASAVKNRGEWIRGVIDPASRGRSQVDGQNLIDIYKKLGLKIIPAKNEVESGIYATWSRLSNGKIKVFNTLHNFKKEYVIYRRDLNGKIVKENDHLMDALRYIVNNLECATQKPVRTRDSGEVYGGRKYDI